METFKNKITFIVTLITSFYIASSCCNGPRAPETYWLDEELLDYVLFLDNTQWIYQDSVSGHKDTLTVSASKKYLKKKDTGNGRGCKYSENIYMESFEYSMSSSFTKKEYSVVATSICIPSSPNSNCYSVNLLETNTDIINPHLFWEPIIGLSEYQYASNAILTNKYSTISFNGKIFTDVIEMKHEFYDTYDATLLIRTEKRYFAKNFGVIRTEIQNDSLQVWNLIEEKIVQ